MYFYYANEIFFLTNILKNALKTPILHYKINEIGFWTSETCEEIIQISYSISIPIEKEKQTKSEWRVSEFANIEGINSAWSESLDQNNQY